MNFQTADSTVETGVGEWCFDVVGSCRDCGCHSTDGLGGGVSGLRGG